MIINTLCGPEEIKELRKCNYCNNQLPLTMFAADASCYRTQCKNCAKDAGKKLKESKSLAGNPNPPPLGTKCSLCNKFRDKKLVFDHNHKTLFHRGWLCDPCNRSIGVLERNLETSNLYEVAKKIKKYASKEVKL